MEVKMYPVYNRYSMCVQQSRMKPNRVHNSISYFIALKKALVLR